MNYRVRRSSVEIGDYDEFAFFEKIMSGEICPSDTYWHEGMTQWKRVEEIINKLEKLPTGEPVMTHHGALTNRGALRIGYLVGYYISIFAAIGLLVSLLYGVYRLLKWSF